MSDHGLKNLKLKRVTFRECLSQHGNRAEFYTSEAWWHDLAKTNKQSGEPESRRKIQTLVGEKKKTCWRVPNNERERVSRANGGTSPTIYRTSISIFSSLPFSLIWTNLFPIYSGIGRYKVVATFIVGSARGLSNIFAIFIGKGFNRDCANSCHKYEEGNEFRFALTAWC